MRSSLVAALVSCVDGSFKNKAHRFLAGLSCDELQFIAEYFGSRILDFSGDGFSGGDSPGDCFRFGVAHSRIRSEDVEHKMILLLEYLEWSRPSGSRPWRVAATN